MSLFSKMFGGNRQESALPMRPQAICAAAEQAPRDPAYELDWLVRFFRQYQKEESGSGWLGHYPGNLFSPLIFACETIKTKGFCYKGTFEPTVSGGAYGRTLCNADGAAAFICASPFRSSDGNEYEHYIVYPFYKNGEMVGRVEVFACRDNHVIVNRIHTDYTLWIDFRTGSITKVMN